jgi:hypothetical protein
VRHSGAGRTLPLAVVFAVLVLVAVGAWWNAKRSASPGRYYFRLQPMQGYEAYEWREAVVWVTSRKHVTDGDPSLGPYWDVGYTINEYKPNAPKPDGGLYLAIDVGPHFKSTTEADGAQEALQQVIDLGRHFTILSRSTTP